MTKDYGPQPTFAWLLVERFIVDGAYQRKIESHRSKKLITKIANNFQWASFGAVAASPREGGWYAVRDGQHRIEAAKRLQIPLVPAMLTDASSVGYEANSFVRQNADRIAVDVFAMHRAKTASGDARAGEIERLLRVAGLVVPPCQRNHGTIKAGEVVCIAALGTLLDRHDWAIVESALQSVAAAYRDEIYGIRAPFLIVAAKMLAEGEVDQSALTAAFRQSTARELFALTGPSQGKNASPARIERITEILRDRLEQLRRRGSSESSIPQLAESIKEVIPYAAVSRGNNASALVTDAGAEMNQNAVDGSDDLSGRKSETVQHRSSTSPDSAFAEAAHGSAAPNPEPSRRWIRPHIPIIDSPQINTDGGTTAMLDDWSISPPTRDRLMGRR